MLGFNFRFSKYCFAARDLFVRPRAHFLACLLVVLVVSCQSKKQRPVATAAISFSTLPVGEKILSKNRRFVYVAHWYAPGATTATLDTVKMTASGVPFDIEPTQVGFTWLFRADTLWPAGPTQGVGAVENKAEFWIHPPRYGHYRILELNPFPHIKLPAVRGRTWEWSIYPPADIFADPAWASWRGIIQVKFRYTLSGTVKLATPLGSLPCYRVQATAYQQTGHHDFGVLLPPRLWLRPVELPQHRP